MSKKVAIILAGCGTFDGSEPQESVCSILAIEEAGFTWRAFALDENQQTVISHSSQNKIPTNRNMMAEAGRLTHGKIDTLDHLRIEEFDIIWFPGGFGVASSFSNIVEKGLKATIHPKIQALIQKSHQQRKIIVGVCIAPAVIAKVLEEKQLTITLGESDEYYQALISLGHDAKKCSSIDFVFDERNGIYSTPAFMNKDNNCATMFSAMKKLIKKIDAYSPHG
jgi:enhancing lycopene biosynthesis protein 2